MKNLKYFFAILILINCLGCKHRSNDLPKIKYSGYYIPIEGGHIDMKLDSLSSINDLILKLRTNNKLYETGKGYWIGYNDLMFSIAVHSDRAIKPLLDFIDTSKSYQAKVAAILTIHLIGINCEIIGRDSEDFLNIEARDALIKLLHKNDSIQGEAMILLIRDPRESDIPKLFNVMDSSTNDCWAISNGLLRYNLKNRPISQKIPTELSNLKVTLKLSDDFYDKKNSHNILKQFSKEYNKFISVEDTLFNYNFLRPIAYEYDMRDFYIGNILFMNTHVDYCFIGNNIHYYYKDNKINICSPRTAKKLWLNWWNSQTKSYKDSLLNSDNRIKRIY